MFDQYFRIRFPQSLHFKTPKTSHSCPRDFKQQFRGSLHSWYHVTQTTQQMFTNAAFNIPNNMSPLSLSLSLHAKCRDTTSIPPSNSNLLVRNVKSKPEYIKLLLFLGTDQGLLNDVYGNSWRTVPIRRLPYTYNMAYSTFKIYRSAYDRYDIRL